MIERLGKESSESKGTTFSRDVASTFVLGAKVIQPFSYQSMKEIATLQILSSVKVTCTYFILDPFHYEGYFWLLISGWGYKSRLDLSFLVPYRGSNLLFEGLMEDSSEFAWRYIAWIAIHFHVETIRKWDEVIAEMLHSKNILLLGLLILRVFLTCKSIKAFVSLPRAFAWGLFLNWRSGKLTLLNKNNILIHRFWYPMPLHWKK